MTRSPGPIPARTRLALAAGRATAAASRRLGRGRGATVGGGVALRIDPDALRRLAAGRQVALVSATNGKSTTSWLLAEALGTAGAVAYNATGANMAEGAGNRAADVALRMHVAGLDVRIVPDPAAAIRSLPPGPVDVAASYPAFLALAATLGG